MSLGVPGIRDPEGLCSEFLPGPKGVGWIGEFLVEGKGNCQTDGHYLCGSCIHNNGEQYHAAAEEERQTTERKRLHARASQLEEQALTSLDADTMVVAKDAWAEYARSQGRDDATSADVLRCGTSERKLREGYRPVEQSHRGKPHSHMWLKTTLVGDEEEWGWSTT